MAEDTHKFLSGQPIICQLLTLIPNDVFKASVKATKADHYYKKMKAKEHFIALFYAVLTHHSSLREVCKNIAMLGKKLMYFGMKQLPCKSTLADANAKRSSKFFATLYKHLYLHYQKYLLDKSFTLPIGGEIDSQKVEVFDSTTITLFKEIFKGAGRNSINGKKKGGIKAFTKMNLQEKVPDFVCFKASATNENTFLQVLKLEKGSIAVFDKGFNRYKYFDQWNESGCYFVTRLKDNARYEVVEDYTNQEPDVISDQVVTLTYKDQNLSRTVQLRLISYVDPESGELLRFLTNLMEYKALSIALLYRHRWTIEVLFKQIKQSFELKYFLSDSQNGIQSQIWVALILNLIFTVLHKQIKEAEDFITMVRIAAKNLCSYVNLIIFLTQTEKYVQHWYREEIGKVQLNLFEPVRGG